MRQTINIFLLWALATLLGFGQDSVRVNQPESRQYAHVTTLKVKALRMATDVLQNIYILDESGELIKYDPKGKELYRFTEFSLGAPAHVDATNPFKVLLYYPEYQTIVTLDNTLSKTGEFDLYNLRLDIIEAICFSNDGNIWLYDPVAFKLKKIDRNARTLLSSKDLTFNFDAALEPVFLIERENWIFVNDPDKGIYLFDVYGEFSKKIDIPGLERFQVIDKQLIYFKDQKLFAYNLESLDRFVIQLPKTEGTISSLRVEKRKLYLAFEDEVRIYSF